MFSNDTTRAIHTPWPKSQAYDVFHYSAGDGARIGGRRYLTTQPGHKTPILCLAGLTRNGADFHELAMHLTSKSGGGRNVYCLDMRGRGMSDYASDGNDYDVLVEAADTVAGMDALGLGHVAIVGTSRGGLLAMIIAVMRASQLSAVVLNDIGPEIEAQGLVRIKRMLEKERSPKNWHDAYAQSAQLADTFFPALNERDRENDAHSIYEERQGKLLPQYDPKLLRTVQSVDLDSPLPTLWPQFKAISALPVLTIRGEFSDLLSQSILEQMKKQHPGMETVEAKGQGHAPVLHHGDLPKTICGFLNRVLD